MQSSTDDKFKGRIYIPPCRNERCEPWLLNTSEVLKTDFECITKNCINGPFLRHFRRMFEECDFIVLHYCPYLWKRVLKFKDELYTQGHKVILVRFEDGGLSASFKEACKSDTGLSIMLNNFFSDFDSAQVIENDSDFQSFKDEVLLCVQDSQSEDQNVDSPQPCSVYAETDRSLSEDLQMLEEDSENEEEDINQGFKEYTHILCNNSDLKMYVAEKHTHFDGCKKLAFDLTSLAKTMRQINHLREQSYKEEATATWKYILIDVLPKFYQEKDVHRLAFFSMCTHLPIYNRALDMLEILLWEKAESCQDINTMIHLMETVTLAITNLLHDYEVTGETGYLVMVQRLSSIYLIVIAAIFILGSEKPEMSSKCSSYLSTRSKSVLATPGIQFDEAQHSGANQCLRLIDTVMGGATKGNQIVKSAEKYLKELAGEDGQVKSGKKNSTVHLVMIYQLLRKVFDQDGQALSHLMAFIKRAAKEVSPFGDLIANALTLFLAYKTQQISHRDINAICEDAIDVIRETNYNGTIQQENTFLQRLLFNSNSAIRRKMIQYFKEIDLYEKFFQYLQNEIEQHLNPMLTSFKVMKTTGGKSYGWEKATGKFEVQEVWIYLYKVNEKGHKEHGTGLKTNEDPYCTEIKRLSCLQHKSIIKMFAYQLDCIPQFYIVENCEQNLQENLKNKRINEHFYTPSQLIKFLVDAVSALKYCHSKNYVHCNLTAESLVVVDGTQVKLNAFGLCKMLESSTEKAFAINSDKIPRRWSAPESILDGTYSKASDIWMVGHLLYEVMTHGMLPYSYMDKTDEELITLMEAKSLELTIDTVIERKRIQQLLSDCTSYREEVRLEATSVKAKLKSILWDIRQRPEGKVVYPKVMDESKASTNCARGVPKKFHKRTGLVSLAGVTQNIRLSPCMELTIRDNVMTFREKLDHKFSADMESHFSSANLDNILPSRRKIHQYAEEKPHIECVIPKIRNCHSLLDIAFRRERLEIKYQDIMLLVYRMSVLLSHLHQQLFIIGDVCPANVYVELANVSKSPQPHIISLAYLRKVSEDGDLLDDISTSDFSGNMNSRAAPEVLKGGSFSLASDVFCFSNFMWELLTAFESKCFLNKQINVYKGKKKDQIHNLLCSGDWKKMHPKPSCCPNNLYLVMLLCVSIRENERPSMSQVSENLKKCCEIGEDLSDADSSHSYFSDSDSTSSVLTVGNPSVFSGSSTSISLLSGSSQLSRTVKNPSTDSSSVTIEL